MFMYAFEDKAKRDGYIKSLPGEVLLSWDPRGDELLKLIQIPRSGPELDTLLTPTYRYWLFTKSEIVGP